MSAVPSQEIFYECESRFGSMMVDKFHVELQFLSHGVLNLDAELRIAIEECEQTFDELGYRTALYELESDLTEAQKVASRIWLSFPRDQTGSWVCVPTDFLQ
jgi:hypothetical protein